VSAIIISGISIAIFLLTFVLGKKNKLPADKFLVAYLLFFIVSQIYFFAESTGMFQFSSLMILGRGFFLLGAPLFFYYVYTLTQKQPISLRLYIFTLLPYASYIIVFIYYYLQVFGKGDVTIENGLLYIDGKTSLIWTFFIVLFILTDPFYLLWFYILLRSYRKRVLDSLSSTEQVNLNWLNILFYIWAASAFVLVPFAFLSIGHSLISPAFLGSLTQLANVAFIFIAGYYGFKQTTVFSEKPNTPFADDTIAENKYQRSGLTKEQAAIYREQLIALMTDKKLYLNSELNSAELAREAGISVNYLSQVLNQELHQNFFDFVNSHRVIAVQEKMRDPRFQHLTLLAIALESGFNSKTSFNTVFKKFTNQTPSQYYRALKSSK
jgi:AraC-like DNA-binding protein